MHPAIGGAVRVLMNRASRTGPSVVINEGTDLGRRPGSASATCGLVAGTAAATGRERVTLRATIAVERRPQTRSLLLRKQSH